MSYVSETQFHTLREERRLRVFQNRVQRKRLHSEQLHDMHSSPYQIKKDEMGWECHMDGGKEKCIQCFGVET